MGVEDRKWSRHVTLNVFKLSKGNLHGKKQLLNNSCSKMLGGRCWLSFERELICFIISVKCWRSSHWKRPDIQPWCLGLGGGGGRKVPAAHNSKTILGIEMKLGRVVENHKLINCGVIITS